MDRISVHISTLNRATEISLLLQSLMHQTFKDFDIVIIDGSDTPLRGFHFYNKLVMMLMNKGHKIIYERALITDNCAQRNQAVKADTTGNKYICRIDDDCIVDDMYLERLWLMMDSGKYDAVSGVTPSVSGNEFKRNPKMIKGFINDLQFDKEGRIIVLGDDCGFDYLDAHEVYEFPAKHLRSSFMYKREVHDKGITYKTPGRVAFREETEFCLRMAWAGYNRFAVDVNAKAYHLQAPSGGCRAQDYINQVNLGDGRFRVWAKRTYLRKGDPFDIKAVNSFEGVHRSDRES